MPLAKEIKRRRTFAIISHPDAGKTTMTEKLLLYGGAVQLAGSVTARKQQRATTSDWMELERQRGISISSTALQFEYAGYRINLLDTPGHKDFSEDTYRVLTAVDAVVMIIDAAKGIESQTRKLFEVCHQRGVPIFTFMNKCDRPTRDPLALVDELENVLQLSAAPVNWPIGTGQDFKGLYHRITKQVHLFERTVGGAYRAPVSIGGLSDPVIRERIDEVTYHRIAEELAMLDQAGTSFDPAAVLSGYTTPVFFGSAMNNFGVQLLLDTFLEYAPAPRGRQANGRLIAPGQAAFSGFIFKIQANMDPHHRDRVAFLRVISGKFERDMLATHVRTGKKVRLSRSAKLFANERETVDVAYPGDIIGLVGHPEFGIGDTLSTDPTIVYREIPRFPPACFAYLHNPSTAKYKQFRKGLDQLLQEGTIQRMQLHGATANVPLLAAVGPLQFEVVQYRLQHEYGAASRLEPAPWTAIRWLPPDFPAADLEGIKLPTGARIACDTDGHACVLFGNDWSVRYFGEINAQLALEPLPPERGDICCLTGTSNG
ncbi:MAG: peptide chain release factor 3 [Kiritimatiellaeota bacterium]|nr:peptide chain release factor 3 [Kiritimatiellota bacterium]